MGITPACAGKTRRHAGSCRYLQDHPRMCGKDHENPSLFYLVRGSPPHVRERPIIKFLPACNSGITPACAGKTCLSLLVHRHKRDHPRMCGKDVLVRCVIALSAWITPACAGKTKAFSDEKATLGDHPRMCGKDSNGSFYFRPFTPADIQNLFNFFAKHLTSSASPNAR